MSKHRKYIDANAALDAIEHYSSYKMPNLIENRSALNILSMLIDEYAMDELSSILSILDCYATDELSASDIRDDLFKITSPTLGDLFKLNVTEYTLSDSGNLFITYEIYDEDLFFDQLAIDKHVALNRDGSTF